MASSPERTGPSSSRLFAWLLLLALTPALSRADEGGDSKQQVGTLEHRLPAKPPTPPDDPEAAQRLSQRTQALLGAELDWHDAYVRDPSDALSPAAQATLALARDAGYERSKVIHDLQAGGAKVRPLIRNLDVGRHEILKVILQRAMVLANTRLEADGLTLLQKAQAVNAGGTGDYTRDQDITLFADDPVRERYFFQAIAEVAGPEGLGLKVDVKPTGGIDFPEIEVTFFRGGNDLPDARFATDVEEFSLRYEQAIANQAADREAYKGGGADIEVKGRRVPGQMYVQQLTWENGRPVYVAETPKNFREGASLFSGTAPERWQRFERAAHIFSDLVQARQHSEGGHHDVSKGPLKYAGRGIEHLCQLYGMRPWPQLKPEDRQALLRRVWPYVDAESQAGKRMFAGIADALDTAVYVKKEKSLPGGLDGEAAARHDKAALSFLVNATGVTVSQMARDLLDPPAFDAKAMRKLAGPAWDAMSPVERFRFAKQRDEHFRAATGRASMDNLLVAVSMLRAMDLDGSGHAASGHGAAALNKAMANAPHAMRPLLHTAGEYADAWARRQQTSDPVVRAQCEQRMAAARQKLVTHCPLVGAQMPSVALLKQAHADGPRKVLAAETRKPGSWFSPAVLDVKQSFAEHLRQAFPSHADQYREFRAQLREHGAGGYVARRMAEEAFQLDTLADALTLVEMYQGNAQARDYWSFLAVNLVSRLHWGVGPLIQAVQVYDANPTQAAKKFKELGKNLVFMTLSRIVPWAASAKIAFDVLRGTVVVTVGWSVNQANQDLIDALYTGEAGRTNDQAAGTVYGRLRDSGMCVLSPEHVLRLTDPATGARVIAIDSDAVYLDFLRRWTGADGDDVPRPSPPRADAAAFVAAHDAFVRILWRQAEQHGPTWVPDPQQRFVPLKLGEEEVARALRALEPYLRSHAEKEVNRVLEEIAAREYRSYVDAEGTDVVREGLTRRFASDLLGGMIQHWQVRLTAQLLAARDIERTAVYQDWRAIAEQLQGQYEPSPERVPPLELKLEGGRWRPVRREDGGMSLVASATGGEAQEAATFRLEARVQGVPTLQGEAVDGSQPVRVSAVLHGTGEMGDAEKPVKIEIQTQRLKKVRKVSDEADAGAPLEAGDLADDLVVVRALAADGVGPELARTEIPLRVLLPEGGGVRKIPLYRYERRARDGSLRERYVYFERFPGMPDAWQSEGGEVYHGEYETYAWGGETPSEIRRYAFGVLHGTVSSFDGKGRLVHELPYVNGVAHGDDVRYDPDSQGRLVIRYVNGWAAEQIATGTKGQRLVHITYEKHAEGGEDGHRIRGEAQGWWSQGQPAWHGRYDCTWRQLTTLGDQGGTAGSRVAGKLGIWEWFHENGQLAERTDYGPGPYPLRTETFDEAGKPIARGAFEVAAGFAERTGPWELFQPPGTLFKRITYRAGRMHGPYEELRPDGTVYETGTYQDNLREGVWRSFYDGKQLSNETTWVHDVLEGPAVAYHRSGALQSRGAHAQGRKTGRWVEVDEGGFEEQGDYSDNRRAGRWTGKHASSKAAYEGAYAEGKRVGGWTEVDGRGTRSVGSYADDKRVGVWTDTAEDGARSTGPYQDGLLHGRWNHYDEKGKHTGWSVYAEGALVESGSVKD